LIKLQVAAIADDQPLVAVEHAQALRHVVDRDAHALVVDVHPPDHGDAGDQHRQRRQQTGAEGRDQKFGRCSGPRAERHGIMHQREVCREAGADDERDETPIARDFRCGSCGHGRARVGGTLFPYRLFCG
jgi:hypothetical protein